MNSHVTYPDPSWMSGYGAATRYEIIDHELCYQASAERVRETAGTYSVWGEPSWRKWETLFDLRFGAEYTNDAESRTRQFQQY